jgi:hypothetical protein
VPERSNGAVLKTAGDRKVARGFESHPRRQGSDRPIERRNVMALDADDPRPTDLSLRERYAALRRWYQANASLLQDRFSSGDDYARRSAEYIRGVPPAETASDEEIDAVFREVKVGLLEWAYHDSDGEYKMAAYAGA